MSRKKEIIILLIIVFFALVFRLIFCIPTGLSPDSVLYISLSERIAHGFLSIDSASKLHEYIQPGYPALIYIFNFFVRNPEISGIAVSMLFSLLLIPLVYYFNKRLYGEKVGWLASFLVAFNPLLIGYSQFVLTELAFTFFFIASIYLLWILLNNKKKTRLFLFLGILIGVSYYIRIAGLILLGAAVCWLFVYWLSKRISFKRFLFSCLFVILGVLIIITPYLLYLYHQKGRFVITGQQDYSLMAADELEADELDEYKEKHQYFQSLTDDNTDYRMNHVEKNLDYRERKQSLFTIYADQFTAFIGSHLEFVFKRYLIHIILIILAFVFYKKEKKETRKLFYPVSFIPFYLLIYLIGKPEYRYYIPLIPLILSLTSVGAVFLIKKFKERLKVSYYIIIMLIVFSFFAYQYFDISLYFHDFGEKYAIFGIFKGSGEISQEKKVGEYIINNFGQGKKILVLRPRLAYYAGGDFYIIPFDDYESVMYFSKYNKIDFLILDIKTDPALRPELVSVFNVTENEDIKLIYRLENLYLYEIKYDMD
ncbi:MAG: glycosyltransferase family 39 protein [Patescibacteria group bacterium]